MILEIIDIKTSTRDLNRLLPPFSERQAERDKGWLESFQRGGFGSSVGKMSGERLDRRGELGTSTEVPPFIRVGRLGFEPDETKSVKADRVSHLEQTNYPALIKFRDRSAVLNFSNVSHERMALFVQAYLLQSLCSLEPIVVKCTAIDLENFGGTFGLLNSAIPNLELLTTSAEVDRFFEKIPEDLRQRNKVKGYGFPYLYQFNRAHRESALPYHFIMVSCVESDISERNMAVLHKLVANNNAAKVGVYFFLIFSTEDAFRKFVESGHELVSVVEFGDENDAKLEIVDPDGLDTSDGGQHGALMVIPDILEEADLSHVATYCLRHLQRRQPDPVKLPLPAKVEDLWKLSAAAGVVAPIGKTKGDQVMFSLGGRSIVHNALVGGAVGTGKTNLLHAIMAQCLGLYSPDELRLSVLDYKNGTEFAIYEDVPHLYALSLGPGTKFGQDLLASFLEEMQRRALLFKSVGAVNLDEYRTKSGQVLPRHLVIIDEFQVLLQDKKRGMESAQMLEDVIRRGRSFGFNFILSTQSLKDGALSPAAAANVGCRICLRLSETDCCNFLSTDNILPSTFEYTGQAVYNDKEGRKDGNNEFRVAFYHEAELKNFIAYISSLKEGYAPIAERFIYHGTVVRDKHQLQVNRPDDHIYIGLEEGIPPLPKFASLDPTAGPCLIFGHGSSADVVRTNLADEFNCTIGPGSWVEWSSADLERWYAQSVDPLIENSSPRVVVLDLAPKDGLSLAVQSALPQLLAGGLCKTFIFIPTSAVARQLYIDRRSAEVAIYCDQRSFADVAYGTDMVFDKYTSAVFMSGDDMHTVLNVPSIAQSA